MGLQFQILVFLLTFCENPYSSAQLSVPFIAPISDFVNSITKTSSGLVRTGINMFSRTVDRVISTFGGVEDRLRQLLEEFRDHIVRGIPELSIPVLDPLHIDLINFNISQAATKIRGNVSDVTVKHISKFIIDGEKFRDLGNLRFNLDLNLTFPYLTIDGFYSLDGVIGRMIPVFGAGKFWLHLIDFKLAVSAIIKFKVPRLQLTSLSIDIKLRKLENQFDNLMRNKKIGSLFNKAISQMAPEAIDMLWPDIKKPVEAQVAKYINDILENATVASVARRLFNISKSRPANTAKVLRKREKKK